jgi:uncharacterized protein (UPF0335 family)
MPSFATDAFILRPTLPSASGMKLLWMTGVGAQVEPCETLAACATSCLASPLRQREECRMSVTAATAEFKDKSKDGLSARLAKDQLKAIVERIEHLEEEKKAISDDIRDVYAEAKGNGYDVTALRAVIRLRKQDKDERAAREAILETYLHALGMI